VVAYPLVLVWSILWELGARIQAQGRIRSNHEGLTYLDPNDYGKNGFPFAGGIAGGALGVDADGWLGLAGMFCIGICRGSVNWVRCHFHIMILSTRRIRLPFKALAYHVIFPHVLYIHHRAASVPSSKAIPYVHRVRASVPRKTKVENDTRKVAILHITLALF
jgi:hypothetical protein